MYWLSVYCEVKKKLSRAVPGCADITTIGIYDFLLKDNSLEL